jgi:hypothetical protein
MLNAYAAAVRTKDVDAFVGLYADDVRNFDLWAEWSYDGKERARNGGGVVRSLPDDEVVAVKFDDVPPRPDSRVLGPARSPPSADHRMAPSCVRLTTGSPEPFAERPDGRLEIGTSTLPPGGDRERCSLRR